MPDVDPSAFDTQLDSQSPPGESALGVVSTGAIPSITGAQDPARAAYETQAGPVLDAFDQRLAAQKANLAAAQKAQAAAQAAATTAAARHVTAVHALQAQQAQQNAPQGAFTPPALSLSDYLKQHGDDDFEAASQEAAKQNGGLTADQMYDKLIDNKYIQPADQPLSRRQKGEALTHIGLEMLRQSTSRNRWTQNPVGAFGAAGEAGLKDIQQDQQENMQKAANDAHEDYLRSQNIGLAQANAKSKQEADEQAQAGENARNAATSKRDLLEKEYDEQEADARERAELAARAADRRASIKAASAGKTETFTDENGQIRQLGTGKILSVDEHGNPIKVQRSQEDVEKQAATREKARDDFEKSWGASYDKGHPQIAGLPDPVADAARQKAHDAAMAAWDERNPTGNTKTINFSDWK